MRPGARRPRSRRGARVKFPLLAAPAGLAGAHRGGLPRPARVAEFAEDLTQPVVDFLEDRGPAGEIGVR